MASQSSPLAPLTFTDTRPFGQQTVELRFTPTNDTLLDAYENLFVETADFLGRKQPALDTVTVLLQSWLRHEQATFLVSEIDQALFESAFELIRFLSQTGQQIREIEFYREQAQLAAAYLEKEGSHE